MTTFVAHKVLSIRLYVVPIYIIAGCLVLYNIIIKFLLKYTMRNHNCGGSFRLTTRKIVHFQISLDLLILTLLFHFSGGIENPFVVYYVFHMIIASVLLSVWESYLQATFASTLLLLLIFLEYHEIIPHHCLEQFILFNQHNEALLVFGRVAVISSALYLAVFMASSISTRLRSQEQGYWEANQQLQQKDRIKDEYVERVTHDIKAHLAAIKSSLDVVARGFVGPLKPKQQEFVNQAVERTGVLTAFIRQLLKLTQMRLSNNIEFDKISLDSAIKNVLEGTHLRATDKQIQLEFEIEGSFFDVFGDRLSIEEMITNIVLNAIKYSPKGESVKIRIEEKDAYVIVLIKDNGIGIPEEEQPRIFDEFYRASNAKNQEADGTGLGLSIARQIVEQHNGKIWARSQLGHGTTIGFMFLKSK